MPQVDVGAGDETYTSPSVALPGRLSVTEVISSTEVFELSKVNRQSRRGVRGDDGWLEILGYAQRADRVHGQGRGHIRGNGPDFVILIYPSPAGGVPG